MNSSVSVAHKRTQPALHGASPFWSHVVEIGSDGTSWISTETGPVRAELATHIPPLLMDQSVVAMLHPEGESALVIAARPVEGQAHTMPFRYDTANEVLEIRGVKVRLVGQREVAIECGDARLVLSEDGAVRTSGERILSAAIETNRIEGGSIEFN